MSFGTWERECPAMIFLVDGMDLWGRTRTHDFAPPGEVIRIEKQNDHLQLHWPLRYCQMFSRVASLRILQQKHLRSANNAHLSGVQLDAKTENRLSLAPRERLPQAGRLAVPHPNNRA